MNEQPEIIQAIHKIVEVSLHPAFGMGYDPALAVMPRHNDIPGRYLLNDNGELIGLNLEGSNITDEKWGKILGLPGFKAERLEALNLRLNKLTKSPVTPAMTALRHLDLCDNKIEEFQPPAPLKLEHVLLYGNEMSSPPEEIVRQGKHALLNYFRERSKGQTKRLREAKLLLLGEPGAGKTTLARKLENINSPLPGKEESTRGIAIETLLLGAGDDAFTARIWDFGGQQIYHGTHRFFLTKRSLWVILADNRKQNTDFNYWLQMAELYGEESPLYIVVNQSDDRPAYVNMTGMKDRFGFLKEMLAANFDTLAETNGYKEDIAHKNTQDTLRLTNILKARIQELEHVGIEWPKSWTDIRSTLEQISVTKSKDYISLDMFYTVCEQHGLEERDGQLHLSAFLHDLGVILHFQDDPVLRETVILSMDWATQAVFAAYDSFVANDNEHPGFFLKQDVARIWSNLRFNDKLDQLLALMLRFKLCYRVKESEVYVIPELLPVSQPDFGARIPELQKEKLDKSPAVRYSYDFMPKGIFTRFAVEVHRLIACQQQLIWREGAVLQSDDSFALITETYGNREIVLRATGRNSRGLMSIATHHLDEIHASFPKLKVNKLLPCNCKTCQELNVPYYHDHKNLLDRLKRNKETVECGNSYEDVPVRELLDALFFSETEHREPMDKNMASTMMKAAGIKIFISYAKEDKEYFNALNMHLSPLLRSNRVTIWHEEKLLPGSFKSAELNRQLTEADIVLFLVSPDFFGTDYIWCEELIPTIERSKLRLTTAIPVILRPCEWETTPLKDLSALPGSGRPVSDYPKADDAYLEVVKGVRMLIDSRNTPA